MGGMSHIDPLIVQGVLLGIVLIAAFTDVRGGVIPNWLTLPPLVIAPLTYGLVDGVNGLFTSVIGLIVCSVVPLLVFYRGGMAGGDVKLFAAIGAIGGYSVGLQIEFLSLIAASIYSLGHLTWNGGVLRSLGNSMFLALNPILPKRHRRTIAPELMHRIRLGAAILLGSSIALVEKHRELWP